MIELFIPEATPSLNTMLRRHWSVDRKLKAKWKWLVLEALGSRRRAVAPALARVRITRYAMRTICDEDNLKGGVKHLLDALRHFNLITDDSKKHLELIVDQEKGMACTRVHIETLSG